MPLKLNLGLSKKVGLPNYGSLGASCAVEIELEAGLLEHDLEAFYDHVERAYVACCQAVEDELASQRRPPAPPADTGPAVPSGRPLPAPSPANGNGQPASSPGGGPAAENLDGAATERQLAYLRQLAGQVHGIGLRRLEAVAQRICGKPVAALRSEDASRLIDALKAVRAGNLDLQAVLPEDPAS